jgi:hypothetical protein
VLNVTCQRPNVLCPAEPAQDSQGLSLRPFPEARNDAGVGFLERTQLIELALEGLTWRLALVGIVPAGDLAVDTVTACRTSGVTLARREHQLAALQPFA